MYIPIDRYRYRYRRRYKYRYTCKGQRQPMRTSIERYIYIYYICVPTYMHTYTGCIEKERVSELVGLTEIGKGVAL